MIREEEFSATDRLYLATSFGAYVFFGDPSQVKMRLSTKAEEIRRYVKNLRSWREDLKKVQAERGASILEAYNLYPRIDNKQALADLMFVVGAQEHADTARMAFCNHSMCQISTMIFTGAAVSIGVRGLGGLARFIAGEAESGLAATVARNLNSPALIEAIDSSFGKNFIPNVRSANFAQLSYGETFSVEGKFAGKTIDEIVAGIKAGNISPKDLVIEYVIVDGKTVMLNTRSAQALERAGIPREQWVGSNVTNDPAAYARYQGQIRRNNLPSTGTPTTTSTRK